MASDNRREAPTPPEPLGNGMSDSDPRESASSHAGSGVPSTPAKVVCQWKTTRFHDQECERFFDCPTHLVQRSLSLDHRGQTEDEDEDDNAGEGPSRTAWGPPLEAPRTTHEPSISDEPPECTPVADMSPGGSLAQQAPSHTRAQSTSSLRDQNNPQPHERNSDGEDNGEGDGEGSDGQATGGTGVAQGASDLLPLPRISSLADSQHTAVESVESHNHPPSQPSASPTARASTSQGQRLAGLPTQPPRAPQPQPARLATPATSPRLPMPPRVPPHFATFDDLIAQMADTAVSQPTSATAGTANQELPASPRELVLPRWQPDSEVTFCCICRTQFSIFVRKHHCRKCGRVVCNSCSPHRIVIPYQFIVRPPGQPSRYPPGYSGGPDFGGGDRVRLCNPCVPDPNTTPPQTQGQGPPSPYSPHSPSGRHRSRSSVNNPRGYQGITGPPPHFVRTPPFLGPSRDRSVTLTGSQTQYVPPAMGGYSTRYHHNRPPESQILFGTPPTPRSEYFRGSEASPLHHVYHMDIPGDSPSASSSQAGPSRAHAGPSGFYQIPEEDECPVCHRELPSRNLPDFEALRESHITMCVQTHSHHGGAATTSGPNFPPGSSSQNPVAAAAAARRTTGMFPYKATEKDCVDSAECTICLEEFEVGVPMARLECLCRFHKVCILAWWRNHPGRCPVHQHDVFGF